MIDVPMASPPTSPARGLRGASRTSGGIIRGRALGNVFNFADADSSLGSESRIGRVNVYLDNVDPGTVKPKMVLKTEVTPRLKPVLKNLARRYSPIRSESFTLLCFTYLQLYT